MKAELTDTGVCEKRIDIRFEAEEVKEEFDKWFAMYRREITVPGFRKGKAPVDAIRRKCLKDVMENVRKELERRGFRKALQDGVVEVVGEEGLQRTGGDDETQPYEISVTVQVAPSFQLPDYKGLEVETRKPEVTDAEVDAEIEGRRAQRGELVDAEEGAEVKAGDLVQIDYVGTVDGKPVGETSEKAKELDKREGYWVMANPEMSFLPGFAEQLYGLKAGDTKTVEIAFGDNDDLGLAGKTVQFEVTVKKIRTRKPAPLDQAFFDSLGVKDEAALREGIKGVLGMYKMREESQRRRGALLDALVARAGNIEFSPKHLKRHSLKAVYEQVSRLAGQGVAEGTIRELLPKIEAAALEAAPRDLSARYLLRAVFHAEQCRIDPKDFDERIRETMHANGAKNLNDLASRMDSTPQEVKDDIADSFIREYAMLALMARANWTGDDAEEMSKGAKREYRLRATRVVPEEEREEWESWASL
ncbi:MAG: trigger factor [Kiritimatiellae bacterium]|nr:trigger factor [Kiritimatiellia bacterium]